MSLLLNEEFTLYRLRLGYLNQVHDGVGERLITLNTAILNEPAFRAAGWAPDTAAIKRCYSPPIPTTGAAEYFNRPARIKNEGVSLADSLEDGSGGLISGHHGSEDTLGPTPLTEKERRRRRRREHKDEEDDSSDLSDDSDEDEPETVAQSVRFAKMPARSRSNTSPLRNVGMKLDDTPEVNVISPSYRPRTSSLGATEAINQANAAAAAAAIVHPRVTRPRRDTTTSSEMSSDSEALDPNLPFRRKLASRPQKSAILSEKIAEEDSDESGLDDEEEEEDVEVAEASDLSDEFENDDNPGTASPELPGLDETDGSANRSPPSMPSVVGPTHTRKRSEMLHKSEVPELPKLPPGRPISIMPVPSLLTMGLKGPGGSASNDKPYQRYAEFHGADDPQPLWIKIYAPFSDDPDEPMKVPLRRTKPADSSSGGAMSELDSGGRVSTTVSDLIGLALWRYDKEEYKPALRANEGRLENWELRIMEDGEVDMDFPALVRSRPITDFTSNNNRPPQRRAREKPWDEFGLVRAEGVTIAEDQPEVPAAAAAAAPVQAATSTGPPPAAPSYIPNRNPITGPAFNLNSTIRKDTNTLLDAPQTSTTTATPRTGAPKTIQIHFTDPQSFQTTVLPIPTTADTYIAELFDMACARLRLDKALYVLKVRGTQTVAPSDRTVEALGEKLHLDLLRRRFGAVGDFGLGLSGSPGSTSPNAPLQMVSNTPPTGKESKRRKGLGVLTQGTGVQKSNITPAAMLDITGGGPIGRRYQVQRKLPLSFSGSHPRMLVITPEYMQILPSTEGNENGGVVSAHGKVTNVPMSSIVGVKVSRKHPKMLRVLVYREKETKRYDFECSSHEEAESIVADIRVGLAEYGVNDD